jgi:hypothetical protein
VKPRTTPPTVRRVGRSPVPARTSTTHSGIDATSSAARLDGRPRSCASVTRPLPPSSSSRPVPAAPASSRPVARKAERPRRTATQAASSRAAAPKRAPADSSAGSVSIAYRMPR